MRIILEILRAMFIMIILLAIFGSLLKDLYLSIGNGAEKYISISYIAIFFIIFVLYRNKFQFSGWYEGKGQEKLPEKVTQLLIISSVILILLPPIIAHFR